MTKSRAFFNIKTQFDNVGDALIIRELISLASARFPSDVYLARAPQAFRRTLDLAGKPEVTCHGAGGFGALIRQMLAARRRGETCYYFLIPGGLNGERSRKAYISGLVSVGVIFCLKALGIRVCQMGVSYERIGPRHARLLRLRSRALYRAGVRDAISERYAREELGIRLTDRVPDLAWNLFADAPQVAPAPRTGIGFSFRVDKDPTIKARLTEIVERVAREAPASTTFYFVAQVARDRAFMESLAQTTEAAFPGRTVYLDTHDSIDDTLAAYSNCTALLSNRLHGLLLGLRAGAAPVALTVAALDHKIQGVFDDAGLGDRVLDLAQMNDDALRPLTAPISFDATDPAARLAAFFDRL